MVIIYCIVWKYLPMGRFRQRLFDPAASPPASFHIAQPAAQPACNLWPAHPQRALQVLRASTPSHNRRPRATKRQHQPTHHINSNANTLHPSRDTPVPPRVPRNEQPAAQPACNRWARAHRNACSSYSAPPQSAQSAGRHAPASSFNTSHSPAPPCPSSRNARSSYSAPPRPRPRAPSRINPPPRWTNKASSTSDIFFPHTKK